MAGPLGEHTPVHVGAQVTFLWYLVCYTLWSHPQGKKQTEVFARGWPPALLEGPGVAWTASLKVPLASSTPQPPFLGVSVPAV